MDPAEEYDAFYEREFRALFQRLLDSNTSTRNKAGISLLMATYAVGFHAARASELDVNLGRAPIQSQIDETLTILREVCVEGDRPGPILVHSKEGQRDG